MGLAAAILSALAACAPKTQRALSPAVDFAGPRLEADHLVSFDGARLALQRWAPEHEPWAAVVGVHGMSEYADAFYLVGPWLAEQGVAVYAYDQRGFGRSPERGVWAGSNLLTRDLETTLALVRRRHPDATLAVLGESMGAAVVMAALARAEHALADRVILSAPGVRGWSALPWHYRVSLWTAAHGLRATEVRPPRGVKITASDNYDALLKNGRDPLYLRDTRLDMVYGLVSLMEEASWTRAGQREPTLMLYGANDQLVPAGAVASAAARLGPCGRTAYYKDGWHMLLRDLQRERVWGDLLAFLRNADAALPSAAPPIPGAPSRNEADGACMTKIATEAETAP